MRSARSTVYRTHPIITDNPVVKGALTLCGFIPSVVGVICGGVTVAAYALQGRLDEAVISAASMVPGVGALKVMPKIKKGFGKQAKAAADKGTMTLKQAQVRAAAHAKAINWHLSRLAGVLSIGIDELLSRLRGLKS